MANRIDLVKLKDAFDDGYKNRKQSGEGSVILRATAALVKDTFFKGRIGRFTFECDEPPSRGGEDKAPSPLEYFFDRCGVLTLIPGGAVCTII